MGASLVCIVTEDRKQNVATESLEHASDVRSELVIRTVTIAIPSSLGSCVTNPLSCFTLTLSSARFLLIDLWAVK